MLPRTSRVLYPLKRNITHSQLPILKRHISQQTNPPSQGLLSGQRCLITGASRGIGKAIAERFAREGASLVLVGRDKRVLEGVRGGLVGAEVANEEQKEMYEILVGDVGEGGFWREVGRDVKNIDILINAAGITHSSPLIVTTEEMLEDIMRTNLMGTMLACRYLGRGMVGRRTGCIINVASLLGLKGGRGSAGYAASKAGVIGFTRALSAELGAKGVRVNVIVPGYIETDMTAAMTPEARSAALNAIPLKSFGEAEDIADAAVFLTVNKYANNCVLNLDGGLSAV